MRSGTASACSERPLPARRESRYLQWDHDSGRPLVVVGTGKALGQMDRPVQVEGLWR